MSSSHASKDTSIDDTHRAYRTGEYRCTDFVQTCLDRIEALNRRGPDLKAVITVNPHAVDEARKCDELLSSSQNWGRLLGVPVLLKDNVNTRDLPTTLGTMAFQNYVPPSDATVVQKLRSAGAVILGKANLHEMALSGESYSTVGGQALNPYDLTRTPGGSSGGSAAAVAANLASVGIGTDTVNSVRSPASACCVVGVKPTKGLISRYGIAISSLTQDSVGTLTRTVSDAAIVLAAISGYDSRDPATAAFIPDETRYSGFLRDEALQGARIGVLRSFLGRDVIHREVNEALEACLAVMENHGADVLEVTAPIDAERLLAEQALNRFETVREIEAYFAALGTSAPVRTVQELIDTGTVHDSVLPALHGAQKASVDDDEYHRRGTRRLALQELILNQLAEQKLDAIVYPHQRRLVVPVGKPQADRNGILAAITGFPAVVVPGGFSAASASAPLGVPIGIEFLGRPWAEPSLLGLAYSFEQASRYRLPPKLPN